jgi:hypothetical protein
VVAAVAAPRNLRRDAAGLACGFSFGFLLLMLPSSIKNV